MGDIYRADQFALEEPAPAYPEEHRTLTAPVFRKAGHTTSLYRADRKIGLQRR
jgi:hypothetical protein